MADLAEIFKQTLGGLTEKFRQASGDLNVVVGRVSEVIEKVTGLPIALRLAKVAEDVNGTTFGLQLSADNQFFDVLTFYVPAKGYPIIIQGTSQEIANKIELESIFESMAANPDSPLMQQTSFIVRQTKKRRK